MEGRDLARQMDRSDQGRQMVGTVRGDVAGYGDRRGGAHTV